MKTLEDGDGESDEDEPTPSSVGQGLYKCGDPKCINALRLEPPTFLYNLACNYRNETEASLLLLIRCRNCAEAIAKQNGREIGEQGCGVYPLILTLRQMKRREDDPIPAGVATYACSAPTCSKKRRAEDMYNLGIGRPTGSYETLLPHIRCSDHAREAAAAQGKEPCEPGSNVFRLSHTLRWMKEANKGS